MSDETDIYRASRSLIDQYGDRALMEAQDRLQKFHVLGDRDSITFWQQIVSAIQNLDTAQLSSKAIH